MEETNKLANANETAVAPPQQPQMQQVTQYRSMWNDKELLQQAYSCAKYLSDSALVPADTYQRKPENCLNALDLANRSGMSPLTIMQNLYIV